MSDILIALLLGVVQGLTEFLPVSSSGHLAIFQGFFGPRWLGDVLFNVSVHVGTTLAVVVFFLREILALLRGINPMNRDRHQTHIIACIVITTAITGLIGILFREQLEALFSLPRIAAAMLLVTGALTFATDRLGHNPRPYGSLRLTDAAVMGLFQGLAIIPGISRSGSTIFAGVACGLDRTWAASYSFIAAIPAIMGAAALEWSGATQPFSAVHLIGALTSFIVGLISLKFLVWTLKRHNFFIFSVYCWITGSVYLLVSM